MPPNPNFEARFNMLYSFYSIPNIVLPFFAGSYVDRVGGAICFLLFASLVFGGQFIFALGIQLKSWPLMIVGRTIEGVGGENICVARSSLLAQWFLGKESAFSMSFVASISRFGSALNNIISPMMANSFGTSPAAWVGVLINSIGVGTGLFLFMLDKRVRAKLTTVNRAQEELLTESLLKHQYVEECSVKREEGEEEEKEEEKAVREDENTKEGSSVTFSDVKRFGPLFWLLSIYGLLMGACVEPFNNVVSGILLERNYFVDPPPDCKLRYPDQCTFGTLQNGSNPSTDLNGNTCPTNEDVAPVLPSSINVTEHQEGWHEQQYVYPDLTPDLLIVMTRSGVHHAQVNTVERKTPQLKKQESSYYIDCNDPFWSTSCTSEYCGAQNAATEKAGVIMSIPYLMSAVLLPFLGLIVDKIGYWAIVSALAPLLFFIAHLVLALQQPAGSPVGPLIGQGLAMSFFAAVFWASVPLTVEERLTGTAYGVIMSAMNVGFALFPMVVAGIYNATGRKYIPGVEFFFVACAVLGLIVSVCLNIYDGVYGGKLNAPSKVTDEDKGEVCFSAIACENMSSAEII
eukprot:CAMPEP_0172519028 /NCGR_PEP_ID=MMETSP1066-20121228/291172_1 /TAXON_ID=671091 /ORGANISM="Coscinodiscus wailesii, Strain CCMP2513" /LENGTH=572 /DNA_ID=CAMNT_0013301533 /DNA_START=96 /DNA_END=1815 /DNA_ORIENTATION=+